MERCHENLELVSPWAGRGKRKRRWFISTVFLSAVFYWFGCLTRSIRWRFISGEWEFHASAESLF